MNWIFMKFGPYLRLTDILFRVNSIKARRGITPLKFLMQYLTYITRQWIIRSIFVPVIDTLIIYGCEFTCLFYSVLIRQLVVKCLFVEVRLAGWIVYSTGGGVQYYLCAGSYNLFFAIICTFKNEEYVYERMNCLLEHTTLKKQLICIFFLTIQL
jgi:hypothetical protein